jgi:hypothetical protein
MNILKINNGRVEIRRDMGNLISAIGNGDATSARRMRDDVAVTTNKGKTETSKRIVTI